MQPRRCPGTPAVAAAVLLLATVGLAACQEQPAGPGGPPPPPSVTVAKPVVKEIIEDDEFVGRFEAIDSVSIRARVGGYLQAVHFQDGALVSRGDLLFTIDQRQYQADVEETRSSLTVAEAEFAFARQQLARAEDLARRNNIPRSTLDERRQGFQTAQARVEAAKAALRRAELDLEFTEIRAPIAGRIDEKYVSVGNLVSVNQTELTRVVSLDPIYFYFDIDERSALAYARDARARGEALQEGGSSLPITVTLSDRREPPRPGVLNFAQNRVDEATGTLRMRAWVKNPDLSLLPGLFGTINVPGSLPYRGILVPDEAIGADLDRRIVYVVGADNAVTPRVVRPGPRIDGYRVIRDGLAGDETLVVNGLLRVRPGVTVTPEMTDLPPVRTP